jgi:hypothetical protein
VPCSAQPEYTTELAAASPIRVARYSEQLNTPHRRLSALAASATTFPSTTAAMSTDLVYDQAARTFVTQLSNISAPHWTKAADTPDDVLEVWT